MVNRRHFLRLASAGLAIPVYGNYGKSWLTFKHKDIILTKEALRIHRAAIVVDGHNDLPCKIRLKGPTALETLDLMANQTEFQTDIPRLLQGGVGAQFWIAVGWMGKKGIGRSGPSYCLEEIDLIHKMTEKYPAVLEMAYTANDIISIRQKGKIASLIGIEGGNAIENSLGVLGAYYRLGARYMTLTLADTIDWVDSATDEARHGGLTEFGEKVVLEMNRLGMLVDISHISAEAMRDVLYVSQAPIIASHSSAFALSGSPRNVPDDVLQSISKNGGIVMVNFFPAYLTQEGAKISQHFWEYLHNLQSDPNLSEIEISKLEDKWIEEHPFPKCSVENVVDHIEHVVKTAGIDHVGLGSDFDGIPFGPDHLEDVSCFPYITQVLLNRGYKEEAIYKILGGNFIRVFQTVEEKARNLRA
jgi:membrane dipeptidase